uniref:SFRICE_019420 n=1 Tax=Spodoptera frugiperda TaxID=7108 RepID=A0A2H1VYQ8_SPOFR
MTASLIKWSQVRLPTNKSTFQLFTSLRRLATTAPAEPPPTTTKSYSFSGSLSNILASGSTSLIRLLECLFVSVWRFAPAHRVGEGLRLQAWRPHPTTHYSVSCKLGRTLESGNKENPIKCTFAIVKCMYSGDTSYEHYCVLAISEQWVVIWGISLLAKVVM